MSRCKVTGSFLLQTNPFQCHGVKSLGPSSYKSLSMSRYKITGSFLLQTNSFQCHSVKSQGLSSFKQIQFNVTLLSSLFYVIQLCNVSIDSGFFNGAVGNVHPPPPRGQYFFIFMQFLVHNTQLITWFDFPSGKSWIHHWYSTDGDVLVVFRVPLPIWEILDPPLTTVLMQMC